MFVLSIVLYVILVFSLGLISYNVGNMTPWVFNLKYFSGYDKNLNFVLQIIYCYYYMPVVILYWYFDGYVKKVPWDIAVGINTTLIFSHVFLAYFINCNNKVLAVITSAMIGMTAGGIMLLTLCCIPKNRNKRSENVEMAATTPTTRNVGKYTTRNPQ